MNLKEKLDIQKSNYEWLLNSINSADMKAGYLIGLELAVIGYILSYYNDLVKDQYCNIQWFVVVLLIVFAISMTIGIIFSLKVIKPRFNKANSSIFYFKSINSFEENKYHDAIMSISEDGLIRDLNTEIYKVSIILEKKYTNVSRSFVCFFISVILLVLIFVFR